MEIHVVFLIGSVLLFAVLLAIALRKTRSLKRVIAQLQTVKENQNMILNDSEIFCVRLDRFFRIRFANEFTVQLLGFLGNKGTGAWFPGFVQVEDREIVESLLKQAENHPGQSIYADFKVSHGEKQASLYSWIIQYNPAFEGGSYLAMGMDITARKKRWDAENHENKMEALGRAAAEISGDFNNYLTSMNGFSELAMNYLEKDHKAYEYLQKILDAGMKAREVVSQVSSFSEHQVFPPEPVFLTEILQDVETALRANAPAYLDIRFELEEDGVVMANPAHLQESFMHIANNAIQALNGADGKLVIRINSTTSPQPKAMDEKEWISILFEDNGAGISQEQLQHIFDPYFTTKGEHSTLGIGLSMVHSYVHSLGGLVRVDSKLNKGTNVEVLLPLTNRSPAKKYELKAAASGNEHILLVDDESLVLETTAALLRSAGFHVSPFASCDQAFSFMGSSVGQVDLVVVDLVMPEMSGLEFFRKVRLENVSLPGILYSAYGSELSPELVQKHGFDDYMVKPFTKSELVKMVRRVLDKNRVSV